MRCVSLALTAVLVTAPAAAAPGAVQDFRLPSTNQPAPPSQTRQGPIAPDIPESRNVRTTAPPEAEPVRQPTPSPEPQPAIVVPAVPVEAPAATAARPLPQPRERVGQTAQPAPAPATAPVATASPTAAPSAAPSPGFDGLAGAPPAVASPVVAPPDDAGFLWPWAVGGALLAALFGAGGWLVFSRRGGIGAPAPVPTIVRPHVPSPPHAETAAPAPTPPAPAPTAPAPQPLELALAPVRFSLTLMNSSLAYRLEVLNPGPAALTDIAIEGDMISAHASLAREMQLSGPGQDSPARHSVDRIEPGETRVVEGEIRLPLAQIVPIRQGEASLMLPLARFRATAKGGRPVIRTFAVGQPAEPSSEQSGAALQPFRLDLGPRIYPELAHRAFA